MAHTFKEAQAFKHSTMQRRSQNRLIVRRNSDRIPSLTFATEELPADVVAMMQRQAHDDEREGRYDA